MTLSPVQKLIRIYFHETLPWRSLITEVQGLDIWLDTAHKLIMIYVKAAAVRCEGRDLLVPSAPSGD